MSKKTRKYSAVTLNDVAHAANVSAVTASRALRTPEIVAPSTVERVKRAVDTLGYVPNPAARALASSITDTIGVIIPSVTNSVYADVLRGLYDVIDSTPLQVQLGNSRYMNSKEDELIRLFAAQKPRGLIITGIDQSEPARVLLDSLDCPIVQIMEVGADPVDMMIGSNHRKAAREATEHLIAAGYRRIAFFGARMDPRAQRRLDGYVDALTEAGLLDEKLIFTTTRPSSVSAGSAMFSDFLGLDVEVDAAFSNNDDIALGILFECQRRRIRVPEQMGIMGFNDLEMVAASMPSISSVRLDRYGMGQKAMVMLLAAIEGNRPEPAVLDMGHELKIRQSTARQKGLET
ncbi:LacI family DNA-binding transcriptional regulator [Pelagibacterium montanilacus]|uniref:LacI family DNA-binding transcriptional regulator n=1 Tax=Pelagibacterium montanilacus TaxID=2185280 RepID=UPI000F8C9C40|nr:LacI family DNA-binding transcriptional regulator [Pelagibacterium montanilacus]